MDEIRQKSAAKGTFTITRNPWRSPEMTRNALCAHIKGKAPGTDGITPEMLANLPTCFIVKLGTLFDAAVSAAHTPLEWRHARVVYIPKAGKLSYSQAKSFRPISLQSFVFKTLEKMAYWHIQGTTLKEKPYSPNQHAFRAGYSTESALSWAVNEVEKGVLRKGYTLAVYLDVSAAFDRLDPAAAVAAMKK
jgi:hypothetical protein